MNLEKIVNGEISIEKFWGQTVIYLPADIGDKISKEIIDSILLEFFSKEKLEIYHTYYHGKLEGIRFYSIEFPGVLINKEYDIPDKIVKRIQEESSK